MTPQEAIEQYEKALMDYRDAADVRTYWREMKNIEAEIIVNGGHGGIEIDGKNAEIREAQLRLARNLHPGWVQIDISVRAADITKEQSIETMKMCSAVIAYETALANERAATGRKD